MMMMMATAAARGGIACLETSSRETYSRVAGFMAASRQVCKYDNYNG